MPFMEAHMPFMEAHTPFVEAHTPVIATGMEQLVLKPRTEATNRQLMSPTVNKASHQRKQRYGLGLKVEGS